MRVTGIRNTMRRSPPTPEERERHTVAARRKRFGRYLERYLRGESVRSYDENWLAFLKERQMQRRQRHGQTVWPSNAQALADE